LLAFFGVFRGQNRGKIVGENLMKKRKIIGLEMGLKAENQAKFKIKNYPQKFDPKSDWGLSKKWPPVFEQSGHFFRSNLTTYFA